MSLATTCNINVRFKIKGVERASLCHFFYEPTLNFAYCPLINFRSNLCKPILLPVPIGTRNYAAALNRSIATALRTEISPGV